MEKRVKKTKQEIELEMMQQADKRYLEEYKELVEPLNDKHGRRLIPIIAPNIERGINPVFAIERYQKIEVQPANEKREEPETDR